MSIHSDVDLLLLYRGEITPFVEFMAERLQYWLWDAGLTIGMATRTIEETVELGREDVTVRTAVLTARFLCGDGEFFHAFADRIRDELLPDPAAFVLEQQELMRERQLEYGDTLYLLQPNVKEGAGTLRDYHTAYWVARGTQPSVRTSTTSSTSACSPTSRWTSTARLSSSFGGPGTNSISGPGARTIR